MIPLLKSNDLKEKDHFAINDIVLHGLGKHNPNNWVLKIGACDGVYDDLTWGWISAYSMNCLFVEPIADRCAKLKEHSKDLRGTVLVENCAVHSENGTVEMVTIPEEFLEKNTPSGAFCNRALYGMSSVYPPKNGLATNEHDVKVVEEIGKKIQVPCYTLDTILSKNNITNIDLLSIDTEGHDYVVFKQFDFDKFSPYWFEIEIVNLQPNEVESIHTIAKSYGYYTYGDSRDLYAINPCLVSWE